MKGLPGPLLRRARLLPGESLPSFLLRLAAVNYYESGGTVRQLCMDALAERGLYDHPECPSLPLTYEVLVRLTGISAAELYSASGNFFANIITPPQVPVDHIGLQNGEEVPVIGQEWATLHLRPSSSAQFCPIRLNEASYHRRSWMPLAAAACLQHRVLLVNRCHKCGKRVSVRSIVEATCSRCGADLSATPPTFVDEDSFGLLSQNAVQSWLGGLQTVSPATHGIPAEPPSVLYRFLNGIQSVLRTVRLDWEYLHSSPNLQPASVPASRRSWKPDSVSSYQLYATAFKAMLDWPDGFFRFLKAYTNRNGGKSAGTIYGDLGAMYSCWLEENWQDPAFQFVQDAFEQYLVDNYEATETLIQSSRYRTNSSFAAKTRYIPSIDAQRILGVGPVTVDHLVRCGRLSVLEQKGRSTHVKFLERREVEELQRRWGDSITLEKAARRLNVYRRVVISIARRGLLGIERGPDVDGQPFWLFSRESVQGLLNKAKENSLTTQLPLDDMVSFANASQIVSSVGMNGAAVIEAAVTGTLRCLFPDDEPSAGFDSMLVSRFDLATLRRQIIENQGWVNIRWVARRMGASQCMVAKWVKNGLLSPSATYAGAIHFDRADVEEFAANYLLTDKVLSLLQCTQYTLGRWIRQGRIKPVSGPRIDGYRHNLFHREDVERLLPESVVSGPEMAEIMGISYQRLLRQVHQGKLVPISGPGVDQAGHRLFRRPA